MATKKHFYVFVANTRKRVLRRFLKENHIKSEEKKTGQGFKSFRLDIFPRSQKAAEKITQKCKKLKMGIFEEAVV